jgi:preprotein translocase subunit SecY
MASAAEQFASNMNFSAFSKADELKKRLWFVLGALIVYRIGTYIPLPGVNIDQWTALFDTQSQGILGMFNTFSGGAVQRMSIFSLGIMPYISASIVMQLMTAVVPKFEQLKKEGEQGRKQINQYTRFGTVLFASLQGIAIAKGLESGGVALNPGLFFVFSIVITLVGGTVFLMWLGEQVTARGVGNGISLIIFSGIVAELPRALFQVLELGKTGGMSVAVIFGMLIAIVALIGFIVLFERAQRRLLVQYPKRQVGNRMMGGETSHLPLKLNSAGVIPPIFASALLMLPISAGGFMATGGPEWLGTLTAMLSPGGWLYLSLYMALIVFFCFFYTSITVNPEDTADNLKKHGGFIPGIRPGKRTAEYLDFVLTRLTTVGAMYLAFVCFVPEIARSQFSIPFYFGGTSLLIVVSVTMDTVAQIQSHLLAHQYEGLIKKSKLRGSKR